MLIYYLYVFASYSKEKNQIIEELLYCVCDRVGRFKIDINVHHTEYKK